MRRVVVFTFAVLFGLMIGRSAVPADSADGQSLISTNPLVREQRMFGISQDIRELNESMNHWNAELASISRLEDIDPASLKAHIAKAREALGRIEYALDHFDLLEARMQLPDDEANLRKMYGEDAVFSQAGGFTLVHLDNPTPEKVATRTQEFDPNEFFFDDCPLCAMAKRDGGHVVFDGDDETVGEDLQEIDDGEA
jgi:hypothetical protein